MMPNSCLPARQTQKRLGVSSLFGRRADKPEKEEHVGSISKLLERVELVRWPLSAPPGAEKRCALVLYGLPKFFRDRSFPSLVARVITRLPFPCDIFIHTYDLRETSNARNGEVACKLDPQEVHVARPLRFAIDSQDEADRALQPLFNTMKSFGDAWFNHNVSLRNVLRQYNSLKRAYALMEAQQAESGMQYSLVCCSRMDVLYLDNLPEQCVRAVRQLEPGTIYVPDFHEWELREDRLIYPTGGMNDRFAIGCRHAMRVYADRIPACVEYCVARQVMFHTETFLKYRLAAADVAVRKMRLRFQRIRGTGAVHDIDQELARS